MRKAVAALAALLIFLTGCGNSVADHNSAVERIEDSLTDLHEKVDNLGASPEETWVCAILKAIGVSCDTGETVSLVEGYKPTVDLSYYVRQSQQEFATGLYQCLADSGQISFDAPPGPMLTDEWNPTSQVIRETPNAAHGLNFRVSYQFTGFDPEESEWVYGHPTEENTALVTHPSATLSWDNSSGASVLHVNRKQTVTKHQSTLTETDDIVKVDIGSEIGFTLGGKESGGSIEGKITANLGITHGVKDVKSISEDESVEVGVNTDIPVGDKVQAVFTSPRVTTVTPFDVDGYIDGPLYVSFDDGIAVGTLSQLLHGPRYQPDTSAGRHIIYFTGFSDLYQALEGTNTSFPGLKGPIFPDCPPKVDDLRKVVWHGTLRSVEDTTVNVSFRKVN